MSAATRAAKALGVELDETVRARIVAAATGTTVLLVLLVHAGFGLLVLVPATTVYVPLLVLSGGLPLHEIRGLLRRA